uniref:NtcA-like transcriptional regulator n=1 Tax=Pyropia dentata TaxID=76160 RepID=A0A6F8SGS6_PYRDN|nr:global nitrogen transcriptional regulator [Neoporphyra dentata]WKD83892.1 global nitrogen transcriptional regulator [Neoporphyra dentata]BCA87323.1 ntcA-like transcriptional regulator [Neoporphyra dentata]
MTKNHFNQKKSISTFSESSSGNFFSYNPWLLFFNSNKISYQIFLLQPNDIILFDSRSRLYIILLGSLIITKVFKSTHKITLNLLTTGDTFGQLELSNDNFYYEAEAIGKTKIVCINYNTIIKACSNYPLFNLFFVNHLICCSEKAYHFTEIISHKSITSRLVSLLLLLAEQNGTQSNNGIILNFAMTHKMLAQIIGSSRVSVTRILSELLKTKLISIQKKKIVVHSPVLLSQRILNK